jgi:hypothetical protein
MGAQAMSGATADHWPARTKFGPGTLFSGDNRAAERSVLGEVLMD